MIMIYKTASAFSSCSTNLLLSKNRCRECQPIETFNGEVSLNDYHWAAANRLLLCKFFSSSIVSTRPSHRFCCRCAAFGHQIIVNYINWAPAAISSTDTAEADEKANDWKELTRKLENCDRFCVPSSASPSRLQLQPVFSIEPRHSQSNVNQEM